MKDEINRNCRKCGGYSSIRYDNTNGILRLKCEVCGYDWAEKPLDWEDLNEHNR